MAFEEHRLAADDGTSLRVRYASPPDAPRGLVTIVHGMAEHSARYARFADALVGEGWAVVAHDHRGHGETAASEDELGHFADEDGWRRVIEDLRAVRAFGRERAKDGPLVCFGHSMGSFIALADQIDAPGSVDALVLSGSAAGGGALVQAGLRAAKLERWRQGKRGKSALLAYLSFGAYNKAFEPTRTEFDWLSRDAGEVDRYVADPRCGFRCTNQLWVDLLEALIDQGRADRLARLSPDMPIKLVSGERDPVGKGGAAVRSLRDQLRAAGVRRVEVQLYPGGRHEMLNETNRGEVEADLLAWMDQVR